MPESTPAQVQREDLIQLLRNRTTGQDTSTLIKVVDFVLDPEQPITVAGIQRIAEVSKPTARRYRDLLVAALERQDAMAVARDPRNERPTAASLERIQADAAAAAAEKSRKRNSSAPLTGDDVVGIIDRTLRRLDADEAPGTAIKAIAELKIRYQQLEAARAERPMDPHKVLGPEGLPALIPALTERFKVLLQHRRELPTFWHQIGPTVLAAILDDCQETTDAFPDPFLAAIDAFVDGIRALRGAAPESSATEADLPSLDELDETLAGAEFDLIHEDTADPAIEMPDWPQPPDWEASQALRNMLIDDPVSEEIVEQTSPQSRAARPSGAGHHE